MKCKLVHIVQLLCLGVMCYGQRTTLDSAAVAAIKIQPEQYINTPNSEYSPIFYDDNVGYVYSSSRGRQVDQVIDEPFYDLGYAARDTSGMLALSASFAKEINSLGHEGPFAISGDLIYFTRVDATRINGKNGYTRKIYHGDLFGAELDPLSFSTDEVSVCHPTLTSDGLTMIYAGDVTGEGLMDLYQSSYIGDKWSDPEKLPLEVNTAESHEFFPFLYQDTLLIFASDRPGGFGGYDLYTSTRRGSAWTPAQLVPQPLNSRWDDLGLIIRPDGKKGYFSSNRPGGKGKDDIYNFKSLKSIINVDRPATVDVQYTVLDKLRFVPIAGANVKVTKLDLSQQKLDVEDYNIDLMPGTDEGELLLKLSPKSGQQIVQTMTDANGKLDIKLSPKANYIISAQAEGYANSTFVYAYRSYGEQVDIVLEPKQDPVPVVPAPVAKTAVPTSLPAAEVPPTPVVIPKEKGAVVVFDNLYYDYNSATIQKGAGKELDALVDAMLLNLTMKVQLSSHTDSRGEANYNLMLSEERALSAKQYLTERGIAPSRIKTKGYGEQQIRNKCTNGTPCSEKEHQYNRRTEVTILSI